MSLFSYLNLKKDNKKIQIFYWLCEKEYVYISIYFPKGCEGSKFFHNFIKSYLSENKNINPRYCSYTKYRKGIMYIFSRSVFFTLECRFKILTNIFHTHRVYINISSLHGILFSKFNNDRPCLDIKRGDYLYILLPTRLNNIEMCKHLLKEQSIYFFKTYKTTCSKINDKLKYFKYHKLTSKQGFIKSVYIYKFVKL